MLTTESGNPIHWGACGPGSCRDKGRGGVDEGAWCLSWLGCDLCAPRSPHWSALPPGQAPDSYPQRSSEEVVESRKEKEAKQERGERNAELGSSDVAGAVGTGDLWRGETAG